ncbi:MAG TPA: serine/threonine-protein kinase [Bryobacteraceae bacterium]|nr:serine/threonine-protein kinase [Bryobacteraceae bacterium]
MSPQAQKEHWAQVKDILATALELPPGERSQFLNETCVSAEMRAEVDSLLEWSGDAESFIEQPAIAAGIELIDQHDQAAFEGTRLGPYRLLSTVGEGGVGTVYRAVREGEESGQIFAIKVLKRGLDTAVILRRFDDERRILSRLNHPNIGRLFDAGVAPDGRPWFAMEFLPGVALDEYCRANELTIDQRVRLFLPICDAVEYSHRNLVVHRDLKAANILVTADGRPRLLDFGIAKIVDPDTTSSHTTIVSERLLTPDYASPEQIAGEAITTATDIYSLGVLLYEVLAGRRPWRLASMPVAEMLRTVLAGDAPKPSSVATQTDGPQISGDLDVIVRKAMHPEPDRRYSSAEKLADDLRRYLEGRPVRARPDSVRYRFRKFLARHRTAAATGAVATVLIFGAAFAAVYEGAMARSREEEARKRYIEMRELAGGLLDEVDPLLENLPGTTAARAVLARKVLHYLDGLARDKVDDKTLQYNLATAYERLGDVQGGPKASNLGNPPAALASYRKALHIYRSSGSHSLTAIRDQARAHSRISDVLALTGDHQAALEEEGSALALRREWLRKVPGDPAARRAIANSLQELAGDFDRLGRFPEALEHRREVLRILSQLAAHRNTDSSLRLVLALAHKRLGRSLTRIGNFDEAAAQILQAIHIERRELAQARVPGPVRTSLAYSLTDMGLTRMRAGNPRAALEPLSEAAQLRRDVAHSDP